MRAMILAAGQGKRMMPLTATTPKPLLRAGEHSLIEWQIRRLRSAGIQQIVINHNHLGEQIEAALGDGSRLDVQLFYSPETDWLETAGGIIQALPLLGEDSFLIANGDVWAEYPFQRLVARASQPDWQSPTAAHRPLAHLVLVPNVPHHPRGDFFLLDNGKVINDWPDGEHTGQEALTPASDQLPQRLTYAGIALLRRELFAGLPPTPRALAPLLREFMGKGRVTGERYEGDWRDIGTPQRLSELDQALRASSSRA